MSCRKWSPATTGLARPSMRQIWLPYIDGSAGPSMAAMNDPLCHKLSPGINFATNTSTGLRI